MAVKQPGDWIPRGDMGLGLCYLGVRALARAQQEVKELEAGASPRLDGSMPAGFVPNFAVTVAPYPVPGISVVLPLPVCFGCLAGTEAACGGISYRRGSVLVEVKGKVPA